MDSQPVNEDLVRADVARFQTLAEDLMRQCYAVAEERGQSNVRLDTVMVIGVLAWDGDDGVEREDIVSSCESRKHHIKSGILRDAIAKHNERESGGDD